jgi:serine/threonine protein kinase
MIAMACCAWPGVRIHADSHRKSAHPGIPSENGSSFTLAPERLAGGRVSVRSDLYALGLVLYEIFTGKRVCSAQSLAELQQMHDSSSLTTPSELVRDLDPSVDRVITHCLEREPELRPASAYAVPGGLSGGDPLRDPAVR